MEKNSHQTSWMAAAFFLAIILIDQGLKWFAVESLSKDLPISTLGLSLQFNPGVFGGLMASVPNWIGQIFFSVLGVFFCVFAWISFYFLEDKDVPLLKIGSVLFGSSLLSNVWDRATRGHVVDYLAVKLSENEWFVINFADIVLGVGFTLISISLIFEQKKIWRELEARKKVWIDRPFQTHYLIILIISAGINAAMIGIYGFAFLGVYLDLQTLNHFTRYEILKDFAIGLTILEFCYLSLVAWSGIYFSHRVAGPIHAFENFIDKYLDQETTGSEMEILKLRKTDHFKVLEEIANRLLNKSKN